ncbi:YitT family protein [Sulfurospirillum arcachonense]|uniref:YitT family protein n=1 Tax=Sulfurospirillum arcachonense TaxID=57666 RepID=UPI0004696F31|nr:YitT family protein [Sulfurospirillum arcachonense]
MKKFSQIYNYIYLVFGTFSLAFGTVLFLSPNHIITGGGIGMALMINYLSSTLTLGMLIALVSLPFVILGYVYFGKYYTFKTFISIFLVSSFTDLLKEILQIKPLTDDILLAAIFGGICVGLGVGLIIKGRSSTGSTSVVGEIVAARTNLKAAEVLLIIDATLMVTSIFVYGDLEKSLYSMLSVYITAKVIDMILTGRPSKKIVNIISNNVEELTNQIRENIEEHGTVFKGQGLHQGQNKTVIYVTVDVSKIQLLKDLVVEYDPDAFLIITEAAEFIGRGH